MRVVAKFDVWRPGIIKDLKRLDRFNVRADLVLPKPGTTGEPIVVNPEILQRELRPALGVAAGFERARVADTAPSVLWDDGANRLLVHLSDSEVRTGPAFIDVTVTVECDQTGRDRVTCTYVTTPPDRPSGFVWATESRPRGPAPVVEAWGEALVALCWRALVEMATRVAAAIGTDGAGQPLVPSTVVATPDGLLLVPMAAHAFVRVDGRLR